MESFEQTKIAMAALAMLTFTVGLSILTGEIYKVEKPKTPGYAVAVVEKAGPAKAGEAAPAAEAVAPIAELLTSADPKRGEQAFRPCTQCHTPDKGGANKAGPNLWNIYTALWANAPGFNYSEPFKKAKAEGTKWDAEALNKFIANPRTYVSGTAMAFAGVRKASDRADIIAYLRALSDAPKP